MSDEGFGDKWWQKESPFDKLCTEMQADGFEYAGLEFFTQTKFDSNDTRFKDVQAQTMNDIIKRYQQNKNIADVKLVEDNSNKNRVFVFLKYKK